MKEDYKIWLWEKLGKSCVQALKKHGFDVAYTESSGGHTWINWRNYLYDFAQLLFHEQIADILMQV